jgi:hypothetical protein
MLSKLQAQFNRGEGTLGWCISKFHDILHMALDMLLFGASENCDTSKGEHGLKIWAKPPSRTTQLSHGAEVFITHLASRLYKQMLINKAHSVLVPTRRKEKKPRNMLKLPTFAIRLKKGKSYRVNGQLKKHRKKISNWILVLLIGFAGIRTNSFYGKEYLCIPNCISKIITI